MMSRLERIKYYHGVLGEAAERSDGLLREARRHLAMTDLFYLLVHVLKRKDANREWIYDRCCEVQASPNGHLDLWAREHYKSTIITFAKTIQDILIDPEVTIGIFSHTRPIAKKFLKQIKRELEANDDLKELFSDVLWEHPKKDAPKWSEDAGLIVRRQSNPKEATVEAWGLVDGQPTSAHFSRLIYDDVVTRESVTSPEMIAKTMEAWEISRNLAVTPGGVSRYIGTRYHFNDPYRAIMAREAAIPRIYPATVDGTVEGDPVLLTRTELEEKRRDMGPYTFGCHARGTKILMADWSECNIENIKVGDYVVGWVRSNRKRQLLQLTRVLAKKARIAPLIEGIMASGRKVKCTPDHLWFSGASLNDSQRLQYGFLSLGRFHGSIDGLVSIYHPRIFDEEFDQFESGWLAGFFDGEGSGYSKNSLMIGQSNKINPHICQRLSEALDKLGFDYSKNDDVPSTLKRGMSYFVINGGFEAKLRFLRACGNFSKRDRIIAGLYDHGLKTFSRKNRDHLISAIDLGNHEVWNIETETGNYVANGYASKNCQMLQNPIADQVQGFKGEWLRYFKGTSDAKRMNKYIIVDPASEKKKYNDYTAMVVIGLGPDHNYYLLDGIRDRLSLKERGDALFELHRRWRPLGVGYEKYGMQCDIEYLEEIMDDENYRFDIVKLGGMMSKFDRIRRMIPVFEQGRFYLLETMFKVDYEGVSRELINIFIEEEYKPFPVALHDDFFDAMSRIHDEDMNAVWPSAALSATDRYARGKSTRRGRRGRTSHMVA